MQRLKVFISYCTQKEKRIAGIIKKMLESYCGYDVFLAHDDMIPSTDFKDSIKEAIKNTDVFIPLLSETYKTSAYTDQECGMALILDKKILPIKIDGTNPYGFLSDYHAYKLSAPTLDGLKQLVSVVGILGLRHFTNSLHEKAKNSIAFALRETKHFKTTNVIVPILSVCKDYNEEQLMHIKQSIESNYEVQGAFAVSSLKNFLKRNYNLEVEYETFF